MFHHLFYGSPPWLMAALTVGLVLHIGFGSTAILSGAGALAVRKGGGLHRRLGTVFVLAMLSMAVAASTLAWVAVERGHVEQAGNIFGGVFAVYLVTTGWLAVRRPQGVIGGAEIGGFAAAVAIAAVALFWLLPFTLGPEGRSNGVPTAAPIILASLATLFAALDLKVILKRGVAGAPRTRRHLWRMCLGMFIATGSFFIGQQKDMPAVIQGSPILFALGFAPIAAMAFWLFRMRSPSKRAPAETWAATGS